MRYLILVLVSLIFPQAYADVMLVGTYQNQDLRGWVMSEKLDGIRGYWDGTQLLSRSQTPFSPPAYFVQDFPPFAIDGELFSRRQQFERISSIVRSQEDKGWRELKLHVFDVPMPKAIYSNDYKNLKIILPFIQALILRLLNSCLSTRTPTLSAFCSRLNNKAARGLLCVTPTRPIKRGEAIRY